MSVVAPRCASQPLSQPQRSVHSSHLPHNLYLQQCRIRDSQPHLRASNAKQCSTASRASSMSLHRTANTYGSQSPFHLSTLAGVHHLNPAYTPMSSNSSSSILPPPRSYYVVSWVPRALPEVVQLIKEIPSEEERCLINKHFELGMLVMRRCGVQNPEEIKCLLDGFREGTTRLSLKDSSAKGNAVDENRVTSANHHSNDTSSAYSNNLCCNPTVERRRLLIFFNDRRASRPWVLCPAKHCIRSARTTGKVKGRVKILQFDQRSTSVKIPKLFMDCLSDFLTRDHYVFATFCPQQKYTDHELDWFGVSDRSTSMGTEYGGDTIFRELVEEHDTKGGHRIWPFEDYIIFSNSQAKILAVFKKKQPLLTLYKNQYPNVDDCLSSNTATSSMVLGSFMLPMYSNGSLSMPSTLKEQNGSNGLSNMNATSLGSDACLQENISDPSHQYSGMIPIATLSASRCSFVGAKCSFNPSMGPNGLNDLPENPKDQQRVGISSSLMNKTSMLRHFKGCNKQILIPKQNMAEFNGQENCNQETRRLHISVEGKTQQPSSSPSPSTTSSSSSVNLKMEEQKGRRKKRRKHVNKLRSSTDINDSVQYDYSSVYNIPDCESLSSNRCNTPLLLNSLVCPTINPDPSCCYSIPLMSETENKNPLASSQASMSTCRNNMIYDPNDMFHLNSVAAQEASSHIVNSVQPTPSGISPGTSGFSASPKGTGSHPLSFQPGLGALPRTMSGMPSSDVIQEAETAEMVLIKVMTGVLAHLEPIEDPSNVDIGVVYHNSAAATSNDMGLRCSMNQEAVVQNCSTLSKMHPPNPISQVGGKDENYSCSGFVKDNISDVALKTDINVELLGNDFSPCNEYGSLDGAAVGLEKQNDTDQKTYEKMINQASGENGLGEENMGKKLSVVVSPQAFTYNHSMCLMENEMKKSERNSTDPSDCPHPCTTGSSGMSITTTTTTTSSSLTGGTDTSPDDGSSSGWFPTSNPEDTSLKEHGLKSNSNPYPDDRSQTRVKNDSAFGGGSEKEVKQRRKMMSLPPCTNAVLYHDLVRQFLSRVAFGLDHPPLPQKRIPDTVKRVVTKIVTDTIRDINFALLSSSLRCYSESSTCVLPSYMTNANSVAPLDETTRFGNQSGAGVPSSAMLTSSMDGCLPTGTQVTPSVTACWQGSSQDVNIGLANQGGVSVNDLECPQVQGSSLYPQSAFDPMRSDVQLNAASLGMNETTNDPFRLMSQNTPFPCYLNGDLGGCQFGSSYFSRQGRDQVLEANGGKRITCIPSPRMGASITSDLTSPSEAHFQTNPMSVPTPEMACFSNAVNNCRLYQNRLRDSMSFKASSTSTTSSNGNSGTEDLTAAMGLGLTNNLLQGQFLDHPLRGTSSFFMDKNEQKFMEKHMLCATPNATQSSFLFDQHSTLSSPLLFEDYLNPSSTVSHQQDSTESTMSSTPEYVQCIGRERHSSSLKSSLDDSGVSLASLNFDNMESTECGSTSLNTTQQCDKSMENGNTASIRYDCNKEHCDNLGGGSLLSNALNSRNGDSDSVDGACFPCGMSCTQDKSMRGNSHEYEHQNVNTELTTTSSHEGLGSNYPNNGEVAAIKTHLGSPLLEESNMSFAESQQHVDEQSHMVYTKPSHKPFDTVISTLGSEEKNSSDLVQRNVHQDTTVGGSMCFGPEEIHTHMIKACGLDSYNVYKDYHPGSIMNRDSHEPETGSRTFLSCDVSRTQRCMNTMNHQLHSNTTSDLREGSRRTSTPHSVMDDSSGEGRLFSPSMYSEVLKDSYPVNSLYSNTIKRDGNGSNALPPAGGKAAVCTMDKVSNKHISSCSQRPLPMYTMHPKDMSFNVNTFCSRPTHEGNYSLPYHTLEDSKHSPVGIHSNLNSSSSATVSTYFESEDTMFDLANRPPLTVESEHHDAFSLESQENNTTSIGSSNKPSHSVREKRRRRS